jgi:2-amino-4-hydroxy-6-hydroxymethyldihydropteridine diphosphokinase
MIHSGLAALKRDFSNLTLSSLYETAAIGFNGDPFYNLVAGFESTLDVDSLGKQLRQIEFDHGRPLVSKKFSSRSLDLDLILYGDLILNEDSRRLPHQDIERYAYVLEPLAEIAPDLTHPISQQSYATLWQNFDKTNLRQTRLELGSLV